MDPANRTTEKVSLLDCPFCGKAAAFEEVESRVGLGFFLWSVGCSDEDCIGWMVMAKYNTRREAAEAWNKRMPVRASSEGAPSLDQTKASADLGLQREPSLAVADPGVRS